MLQFHSAEKIADNRVGGREQDCSRCASHTTVRTGHVYSGSLSCGATFK